MDIDITLKLPEQLVELARAEGILNSERIARLIEAEIKRLHWDSLNTSLAPAREAFRVDHAHMTEDEVMAMINDVVHEVRTEIENKTTPNDETQK